MPQWNANSVPKCEQGQHSDDVLITWIPDWCKDEFDDYSIVSKAVYFPYHHCTTEDFGWDVSEDVDTSDWDIADVDENSYWIPEGWYETIDSNSEFAYTEIIGKVLAWMKLPKKYEPKLKKFGV